MKKTALVTLALVMIFCAVSCAGSAYRDDVSTTDIAVDIGRKISNGDTMVPADEFYLSSFNPDYTSLITEYRIEYTTSGTLFDEFGIFKVENTDDTDGIVKMIEEYKTMRVDNDMGYLPAELPKIKNAKTKVCGKYVMYAFLSDADSSIAFDEFEKALS